MRNRVIQWKRLYYALCLSLVVASCSSTPIVRIGSLEWHDARLREIEEAFTKGEIDKGKYLELKNEADLIRKEYQDDSDGYKELGYGHHSHGSRIGIGVGF